jgi:hypothetical protein
MKLGILTALGCWVAFVSRPMFHFVAVVMTKMEKKTRMKRYSPVDRDTILREHNLTLVEAGFFRGKETIARVQDSQGKTCILKTGGVSSLQIQLFHIAKQLERSGRIHFRVPDVYAHGDGWMLMEEITGKSLNEFADSNREFYVDTSARICREYQFVISGVIESGMLGDALEEGKEFLFSRLTMWSKPIVDAKRVRFETIQEIMRRFEHLVDVRGRDFFGWVHGNIIGDHIIITDDGTAYLLDLEAVSRPGGWYYDFIRVLDFLFLKTEDENGVFISLSRWLNNYLGNNDGSNNAEVRLILALRFIGILGWDILHEDAEYVRGNTEEKKRLASLMIINNATA